MTAETGTESDSACQQNEKEEKSVSYSSHCFLVYIRFTVINLIALRIILSTIIHKYYLNTSERFNDHKTVSE